MKHSLQLVDRNTAEGMRHYHRWLPSCACGLWVGIPKHKVTEAVRDYRCHTNAAERVTRRKRGHRIAAPLPRPVTPADRLPDTLRCSA